MMWYYQYCITSLMYHDMVIYRYCITGLMYHDTMILYSAKQWWGIWQNKRHSPIFYPAKFQIP